MNFFQAKKMDDWRKGEEFRTFLQGVEGRLRPLETKLEEEASPEQALLILAEWRALRRLLRALREEDEAVGHRMQAVLESETPEMREVFE